MKIGPLQSFVLSSTFRFIIRSHVTYTYCVDIEFIFVELLLNFHVIFSSEILLGNSM